MKRIISYVIAIGIAFGSMNFVYADEKNIDVLSIEKKFEAINISLDDVFHGEDITRGDFARLMSEYLNFNPDNTEEYTRFIDVDISHKAVGAINCLYDFGYITGYGEYKYYPDKNITYAEALNIIVNAYGYKHIVQSSNSWINGVLDVAYDLDIMDGVECNINDFAKRTQLLKILDNALEAEVMVYNYSEEFEKEPASEHFHEVYITETVVTGNEYTSLVSALDVKKDNTLYMNDTEILFEDDYSDLLGYHVKCYYKEDEGQLKGLYIEKTGRNNEFEIDGDDVTEFNGNYLSGKDENGKIKKYSVEDTRIIYNGIAYTGYGQLSNIVFPNTSVKLLDNDKDGSYEILFITEYKNYYVSSVDIENEIVYDKENNINVSLSSQNFDVIIFDENQNEIEIKEIAKDTVISVMESKNTSGNVLKTVYVVKNAVSGQVTSFDDEDGYKISDKFYKKSASCIQDILIGQQVTVYLGKDGKITARTVENAGGTFAVLCRMYEDEDNDNKIYMKFYTQNGDFEEYYVEDKVRIDNDAVKADKKSLERIMANGQTVVFEKDGQKIKKIRLPQAENAERGAFRLLASGIDNLSVRGNNGINVLAGKVAGEKGKTSVMLVPSDTTEQEAYGLFDFAQIENMRDKTYKIFSTSSGKLNFADFVVLYDAAVAIINDDSNIYVVENITAGLTSDDTPADILTLSSPENGIGNKFVVGESLDLSLTDGYNQVPVTRIQGVDLSEIERGDTIAVATNAKGEVTRIEKIFDHNDPNNANARFKVDDNLVDTCHYYPNKYVDMSRLIYTEIDAVSERFIQFETSIYPTADDWKNNTNVGWQMEIATMNEDNIVVYNHNTRTSKNIKRNELENYIGKKAIIRVNQCLMQEVIIYE